MRTLCASGQIDPGLQQFIAAELDKARARLAAAQRKALAHGKPGKVNHLIARASQSLSAIVRKTRQAAYKKHTLSQRCQQDIEQRINGVRQRVLGLRV